MLYTNHTLSQRRKAKAGMATILGMLIFVGALFTCVIPLFLYVNQVNNFYDQTVVEMKHLDEDREREQIDLYAYPLSQSSSNVSVYVKNKCPLTVQIVRIWVNDQLFESSLLVPAMKYNTTEPIDINAMLPEEGTKSFRVKVTTSRGNTFSSLTNPLYYTAGDGGGWSGGTGFAINIVIEGDWFSSYNIKVYNVANPEPPLCDEDVWLFLETSYFKRVDIPEPGTYHVTITQDGEGTIKDIELTVDWQTPSHWVYAYGV